MARRPQVWIVVMDSARARIFRLGADDFGAPMLEPAIPSIDNALAHHARDERSDKPGRSVGSTASGLRHSIEPRHDYHKLAKHQFVERVAKLLSDADADSAFERLVLVAPRRSLGELRTVLSESVRRKILAEDAKDLTSYNTQELWSRLASVVEEAIGAEMRRRNFDEKSPSRFTGH